MQVQGQIRSLILEFRVGFITVPGHEDVLFTAKHTNLKNTSFEKLKEGDKVVLDIFDTQRGLFAESLQPVVHKTQRPPLEASL